MKTAASWRSTTRAARADRRPRRCPPLRARPGAPERQSAVLRDEHVAGSLRLPRGIRPLDGVGTVAAARAAASAGTASSPSSSSLERSARRASSASRRPPLRRRVLASLLARFFDLPALAHLCSRAIFAIVVFFFPLDPMLFTSFRGDRRALGPAGLGTPSRLPSLCSGDRVCGRRCGYYADRVCGRRLNLTRAVWARVGKAFTPAWTLTALGPLSPASAS